MSLRPEGREIYRLGFSFGGVKCPPTKHGIVFLGSAVWTCCGRMATFLLKTTVCVRFHWNDIISYSSSIQFLRVLDNVLRNKSFVFCFFVFCFLLVLFFKWIALPYHVLWCHDSFAVWCNISGKSPSCDEWNGHPLLIALAVWIYVIKLFTWCISTDEIQRLPQKQTLVKISYIPRKGEA